MALRDGIEPLHTRIIAYQQEATNCLAYLQHRACANPRAAAIVHQWLYELQLPYTVCPGFDTPVIAELGQSIAHSVDSQVYTSTLSFFVPPLSFDRVSV